MAAGNSQPWTAVVGKGYRHQQPAAAEKTGPVQMGEGSVRTGVKNRKATSTNNQVCIVGVSPRAARRGSGTAGLNPTVVGAAVEVMVPRPSSSCRPVPPATW